MLKDLILKNRSYRRFYQNVQIEKENLLELVDLARLSASGANLQSLKYVLSYDQAKNSSVFSCLKWAGYLKDWNGPKEGERPSAYIIVLGDSKISTNFWWDHGIAAQSILLGACEKGLGGCMFAAIDKEKLRNDLNISKQYEILMVIALGKPKEQIVIEEMKDDDVKYWRDEEKVHHVPKRSLEEIIV
ncbi:MAG: nitroreductase family protein [Clostridiales bacterium]|nr:nitroreductase family protein [Clostridiales bacterium]